MIQANAKASRDGERFWLVYVPEVDRYTQARNVAEIETMARDLVAVMREVDPASVEVAVQIELPDQVEALLKGAEAKREQELSLRKEAADDVRAAATLLSKAGISFRDIGKLLGVSFQRAGQLVERG